MGLDPFTIASTGIPIATRTIGRLTSQSKRDEADRLRQKALGIYDGMTTPDLPEVTPDQQGRSELYGAKPDQRYVDTEDEALQQMMEYLNGGGLAPEDTARLEAAKNNAAAYERGARGANEQRMAARGIRGSGLDYLSDIVGQQRGGQSAYQGAIDTAASAADRRAAMVGQVGSYGRALTGDSYGINANAAAAQDRINQFNTGNRVKSQFYNAGLPQQEYENELGLNDRRYGADRTSASDSDQRAAEEEQFWNDLGTDASNGVAAYKRGQK